MQTSKWIVLTSKNSEGDIFTNFLDNFSESTEIGETTFTKKYLLSISATLLGSNNEIANS